MKIQSNKWFMLELLNGAVSYAPPPPATEFISVWDTEASGDMPGNTTIGIPLTVDGTYDFYIDWGDGNVDHITTYDDPANTHTYDTPGVYTVKIDGQCEGWNFNTSPFGYSENIIDITQWGNVKIDDNTNAGGYFYFTTNLIQISASDSPDLSNTTSLSGAFSQSGIVNIASLNLWDTSTIVDMSYCFYSAFYFEGVGIEGWNVQNVTTMAAMFYQASAFNGLIGLWTTSSLQDMSYMLAQASSFNQSVAGIDTSNVTTLDHTFQQAVLFEGIGIENWITSNVTTLANTFDGNNSGTIMAFNGNVSDWDVSNVTDMTQTFTYCHSFNRPLNWDTSSCTTMFQTFVECISFNQDMPNFVTSTTTNVTNILSRCYAFNGQINTWDLTGITSGGFGGGLWQFMSDCTSFNQSVVGLNPVNAGGYVGAFQGCTALDQDFSSWPIVNITDATSMFDGVTLSTANYNALLISWAAQSVQPNVTFNGGNSHYSGAGVAARAVLTGSPNNWTITDGGEVVSLPFIAVWDTTENGDNPSNATIALPLVELGEYDFYIDWGDGNTDHITAWDQPETSHTYAAPGTYTTSCSGTITGWNFRQNYTTPFCLKDITQWGCLLWDNGNYNGGYFYDTEYMFSISATDVPDLTGVTSLNQAFWDSAIVTINNLELWDISGISDISYCFQYCWLFNDPNINYWDVTFVTNMEGTFYGCQAFNQPLDLWVTASCTNMSYMFNDAESFNQSLNTFNMHSVETTAYMFASAISFNNDIYLWSLPNLLTAQGMFQNATSFNKNFVTTGHWGTPQCRDFSHFLENASSFAMPLDLLDVSSCQYFDEMLRQASLFNQPLPDWSTSNALSFHGTFRLTPFDQDISNFDFSNGPDLSMMFYQSSYNQPFTNDVSACSDFSYMFAASSFNRDVSGMNMSNAISISGIFSDNPSFNQPFGMWNTSLCEQMYGVLANATSFDQDLGGLIISAVTELGAFLSGVTLSNANYNALLVGWAAQTVQPNLTFSGGNSHYSGAGVAARAVLTGAPNNWTITDGGTP